MAPPIDDGDDDLDTPDDAATVAGDRKIAAIEACRALILGTMRGVGSSGLFDPFVVIAALGYTFDDVASEFLLQSAQQKGRIGFEEAKSAMLNLYGLVHEQLLSRMQQLEAEMTREDEARKIHKADLN